MFEFADGLTVNGREEMNGKEEGGKEPGGRKREGWSCSEHHITFPTSFEPST